MASDPEGDVNKPKCTVPFPDPEPGASLEAFMQGMGVARPEVLRGTSAHHALSGFGSAFRRSRPELFERSRQVEKLQQFWSHSWRESPWKKILTLLVAFNGPAALVAGHLAALTAMLLVGAGAFGVIEHPFTGEGIHLYCQCAGFVGMALGFLLWRPHHCIFLDTICIHQQDPDWKSNAIISMGGFLRLSQELLILLDETYTQRLWCVIELAAFIKSREGEATKAVKIRATCVGPAVVAFYLMSALFHFVTTMCPSFDVPPLAWVSGIAPLIFLYLAVDLLRRYHREKHAAHEHLKAFQLRQALCYCCSVNHVNPSGTRMPVCDRAVLTALVESWFGSVESFERQVQGDVARQFAEQLGTHSFSYPFAMAFGSSAFFYSMEEVGWAIQDGSWSDRLYLLLPALVWLLAAGPLLIVCAELITMLLQTKRKGWREPAANVVGTLLLMLVFAALTVMTNLPRDGVPFDSGGPFKKGEFMCRKFLFELAVEAQSGAELRCAAPVVPLQLTPRKPPGLGPVLETPERKSLSPVLETPERPEFFSAAFQKLTPAKFPLGKLSTEHQPGKVEELKEGVWPRGLLPVRAGLQPMEEPHLHRVPLAELLPEPTDARKAWLASQVHEMCQRGAKMSKPGQPCEGDLEKDDKVTETPQGNLIIEFLLRKADDEEVGMKVSHQGNQPPLKVVAIKSTGAIPSWNKLCAGSWEPGGPSADLNEILPMAAFLLFLKWAAISTASVCSMAWLAPNDLGSSVQNAVRASRRQWMSLMTAAAPLFPAHASAASVTLTAKLCSDKKCERQFKSIDKAKVPLGVCSFSEEDQAAVFYECKDNSKLHFRLYFAKTNCDSTPTADIDIVSGQCAVLGNLASGIWTWSGGCGQP
ncbi:unnamed protein product [Effrenium voratum]|nr:unnamed protein product [Effrenium voratum]CAJ1439929.1 unnamed protein product [Effrenium voratum]